MKVNLQFIVNIHLPKVERTAKSKKWLGYNATDNDDLSIFEIKKRFGCSFSVLFYFYENSDA